ncbi:MAG: NAD-dependent epimerase/dehydratase family protein [Dehalococcoidia bacterium]|uniref:NAD-dependent epimerase/dehydratase family protein n=1 Tax=Candidatus Amarobacter glycogenicus TaxID=3140699 RepID=UPI003136318B|nr:NAD-dependent epimerase/dehydratase family protein [Dehalococcoidia bacterium]MBK6560603.1 NAD-dependent epimerase/dehydratase family protein [Dehalococcoidia bacterium]MBK9545089.1 NAD-dependent epimerase/dehydratase family protein [Dehalococcoidia bacterium]
MRILVSGGAGFIGSHIVEAYLAAGHEVAVVDNLATGRRANVARGATLHEVDLHARELERIFAEFRPEVVNHHAAQASVKVGNADPVHDLEVNGGGTARLLQLCVENGVRKVIYSSSGGTVYGEPRSLPVAEDHPIAPRSNYGTSKYVGELYVQLAARTAGIDYTIFRYGNAFGPRQDPHGEAGVIAIFTGLMLAGQPCTIDGDGEQKKDYLYVGDIARANVLALDGGSGLVANIGTGVGITVNHIFQVLAEATENTIAARYGPPRAGDVRNFWLDCALAKRELGWEPTVSFEEGVRLTVESLR